MRGNKGGRVVDGSGNVTTELPQATRVDHRL